MLARSMKEPNSFLLKPIIRSPISALEKCHPPSPSKNIYTMHITPSLLPLALAAFVASTIAAPADTSLPRSHQLTSASDATAAYEKCQKGGIYCFSEIANMGSSPPSSLSYPRPHIAAATVDADPAGYDMYQLTLQYCRDTNASGCESCSVNGCECLRNCRESYFECKDGDGWYEFRGRCTGMQCARGQCY